MCYYFKGTFPSLLRELRSGGESAGEAAGREYVRMLNLAGTIGILSLAIFITKAVSSAYAAEIESILPAWLMPLTCVAVLIAVAAIVLYQRAFLHLAGSLTLNTQFAGSLLHLKKVYFALMGIVISPTLLLYSSMHRTADTVFLYISGIEFVSILCLFLYKSRKLFVGQKISILYWFLYLCIVELFPISLSVSILLRIT